MAYFTEALKLVLKQLSNRSIDYDDDLVWDKRT
jgi:hypothetical protein